MRWLFLVGLMTVLAAFAGADEAKNLIANPGFEGAINAGAPEGWSTLWQRDATPGSALTLDTERPHSGKAALKVVTTGGKDWSVSSEKMLPVTPGDILTVEAWVKRQGMDSTEVSVVTRGADGKELSWMFGRLDAAAGGDWQKLTRRIVVPVGCATVQFRFTGSGAGTAWLDDVSLVPAGNVKTIQGGITAKPLRLQSRLLDVVLTPADGTLTVTDHRTKRVWKQQAVGGDVLVTDAARRGANAMDVSLWDIGNDIRLKAILTLAADRPEIGVTLEGKGAVNVPVAFPQPFATGKGTWLIVPLNEGILYPVDDETIGPMSLVAYGGHGICMPWYGGVEPKSGAGVLTILGTPDDARIEMMRSGDSGLVIRPLWEASRGDFSYKRSLRYVFFDKGGYVAQAKRYREYAKSVGLFKTLAEKRKENPNVDLLIGAANIWNWDMDKVALCKEMKSLGMERILWSGGGSPTELKAINDLGYLSGRYDIFQDVWPPEAVGPKGRTEGWPEDLVWLRNGDWMKGWAIHKKNPDGTMTIIPGGVICSPRGLERAKQQIPADLKTHPYGARFIDTTTASPWRECWNPAHPLTRSQDRHYKMALLEYISKDLKQVVGTETGIDPSVPYVHYYEGMLSLGPYRLPDSGRGMLEYKEPTPNFLKFQVGHFYRIPLWELVYHDCVVAQWYWGDYNNKAPEVWDRRDLFNALYATPPMYMFTKATWEKEKPRFQSSYAALAPTARKLGYDEMLSHEFLTPDHTVQRTRWRSGAEVVVNFGDAPHKLADGRTVAAMGKLVKGL